MSPNPYAAALEELLGKVDGTGSNDQGQRRGIRRAITEVERVWEEQHADQAAD
jgi:hypothetical protein